MKSLLALIFFGSSLVLAAIPAAVNPEYVAPDDMSSTLRGQVTVCRRTSPLGRPSFSFLHTGEGKCPPEPRRAEGYDRPAYETDSPGIPFKNKGLE